MNRNKHILIIGSILVAFTLFVIFVYLPYADKQNQTTKMADSLWPSENLKQPVRAIPAFAFTNQEGKTITLDDVKGKVYVADFFFTSCEASCPMMSTELTKVQKAFQESDDVRILSFALDPADSIPVLRSFANQYGADADMWYFLTGDVKKIYTLGEEGFMQIVKDSSNSFTGHSQKFTLVDGNNMIRGFYKGTDSAEVANLMNDINFLLNKEGHD
ncbi:MAG: SCO family protein [Chitinophagales bacterium]|nr:SCO family protein [Chitinophagales bacterium]